MLLTSTRLALPDADTVLAAVCAHLVEHEAVVTTLGGRTEIVMGDSRALVTVATGTLDILIEASDLAGLRTMKAAIASHLAEFAPPGATRGLSWRGDGTGPSLPPDFRLITVTDVSDVTPHMRRIVFRGKDIARYASLEALHVRLFIPPAGVNEPAWPQLGEDGVLHHPPPEQRAAVRKYTIREIDPEAGTLAIDFVLHEDAGPGSAFAAAAAPGQVIGVAGPGGRGLKTAERYVFLCDETGLPALSRMLENLPGDALGQAFIEVADAGEWQPLVAPPGVQLSWLHRDGALPGATTLLQDAFAALAWPEDGPKAYLWAATEHTAFREIRAAARQSLRPGMDEHLIVSYWRAGMAEEQHASEKKLAAAVG